MTLSPLLSYSRADLCTIGRELMLAAHLQDRASVPAILGRRSMNEAAQLAIDEWMMTSPIYTRRMQRLLRFEGTDVETIFKGLQLDVGFAHQFMDVGYQLHSSDRGEFWLRSCGALADAFPMGEAIVRVMCHDIEDPTFDATAFATNPRARVRPVHRPPVVPRGGPDCHWTVGIDESADPTEPHPWLGIMERSVVAQLPNDPELPAASERGGWDDYSGDFDPGFELERLSTRALHIVLREFAVQGHLLARGMMRAVEQRYGSDEAVEVGRAIFTGIGWIASERLTRVLGVDSSEADALAMVLPLTHFLLPADYVGLSVELDADATTIRLAGNAGGMSEGDPYSLPGLLVEGVDGIVESLVHGVDPTATVVTDGRGVDRTWTVPRGAASRPADEPADVVVARFSTGVAVTLRRRLPRPEDAVSARGW